LSSAFFTFAEETYGRTGNDKLYLMTALWYKITVIALFVGEHKLLEKSGPLTMECQGIIKKLLSMVYEIKRDEHGELGVVWNIWVFKCSGWHQK
jgi:hypothetical protein